MLSKPKIIEKWQKRNRFGRPGTTLITKKIAIHYTGQADVEGWRTVSQMGTRSTGNMSMPHPTMLSTSTEQFSN